MIGAGLATKLIAKLSPRLLGTTGIAICAGAMFWLSGIGLTTSYLSQVMPAIFLVAFGFAMGFVPLTLTAVQGVRAQESGIASALLNTS